MFAWFSAVLYSIFIWVVYVFKNTWQSVTTSAQTITNTDPDEIRFLNSFEQKFSHSHPKFYSGTFKNCLDEAKRTFKPILVYLHSDSHQNTEKFCKSVLAKQGFQEFIDSNFIFYAIDINSKSGYVLSTKLQATSYPFLCVLIMMKSNLEIVKRFDGDITDLDMLTGNLIEAHETSEAQLLVLKDEENIRNFDRFQREEQDRAYQESLLKDQKREQEKKEKEEQLRLAKENEVRIELSKKQMLENSMLLKKTLREKFTVEPSGKETTMIRFKFPDGSQVQRRFLKADYVMILYEYIHQLHLEISKWLPKEKSTMDHYELSTGLPKKILDKSQTLLEADCVPNQTVFVRDTNEEDDE